MIDVVAAAGAASYHLAMLKTTQITQRSTLILVAALLTAGVVAGCETAAPEPQKPELSYAHLGAIRLDVAKVEVVDEYLPPLQPPNVEHEFPISPAEALQQWARDRLQAAGKDRKARFIIRNAAVQEIALDKKKGLRGLFTKDQSERYDGRITVQLEIRSNRGFRDAFVEAMAEESRTVPEDISIVERERVFLQITKELIAVLNAEIEKQIAAHLSSYRIP